MNIVKCVSVSSKPTEVLNIDNSNNNSKNYNKTMDIFKSAIPNINLNYLDDNQLNFFLNHQDFLLKRSSSNSNNINSNNINTNNNININNISNNINNNPVSCSDQSSLSKRKKE